MGWKSVECDPPGLKCPCAMLRSLAYAPQSLRPAFEITSHDTHLFIEHLLLASQFEVPGFIYSGEQNRLDPAIIALPSGAGRQTLSQ